MDLQLPVRFSEWLSNTHDLRQPIGWINKETNEWSSAADLYDNWLENIYQPEQKTTNMKTK